MGLPDHSSRVDVPTFDLLQLIELAPEDARSVFGEIPRGGVYTNVEAVKVVEFLDRLRGDKQLIELAEGSFEKVEHALKDKGFPLDIEAWQLSDDEDE